MRFTRPGAAHTPAGAVPNALVNRAVASAAPVASSRVGDHRAPPISRNRSAMRSGVVSEIQAPWPDSDPAKNFMRPGDRIIEYSCRCRRPCCRSSPTGA